MRVSFRLWSVMRVAAGTARVEIEMPSGTPVRDALDILIDRYPELSRHRSSARVAVGTDYVDGDRLLVDGDEVSLIPPVQGG